MCVWREIAHERISVQINLVHFTFGTLLYYFRTPVLKTLMVNFVHTIPTGQLICIKLSLKGFLVPFPIPSFTSQCACARGGVDMYKQIPEHTELSLHFLDHIILMI